jgi:hypothetical protein
MSNSVIGLSIDCADAAKLARLWADVLGRQVNPQPTTELPRSTRASRRRVSDWRSARFPRPSRSRIGCTWT